MTFLKLSDGACSTDILAVNASSRYAFDQPHDQISPLSKLVIGTHSRTDRLLTNFFLLQLTTHSILFLIERLLRTHFDSGWIGFDPHKNVMKRFMHATLKVA